MVSYIILFNLVAVSTAAVLAVIRENPSGSLLIARAEASVFMCEDKDYKGQCLTQRVETSFCYNVPVDMVDRISSIRNNDRDDNTCTWYRELNCRGDSYRNQDDGNLADGNGHFNDSIRSLECRRKD
ncbi:hypothetical protein CGRA01v4_13370 [Colletotrichum graminicola]|uniref:Beta/gamma crystallin 'Greek key' domain-containing protein n=1 Tax=Colletotrichum graminicola (strain M1.001 / M2 / FGSC 10212) TaxID=645133 RepID=E3QWU9_COLGM|nr:uncharacterized protein GLRG_10481 [Colletotrichum graminicola M1.001]EFQ35337.1 hypothetical protein GLRG_10481 [Colletotrichum graminicola M1.001]WDK22080.1 hypothetical protein CGRA01v4_13370 [Colletotrichum graminicola]